MRFPDVQGVCRFRPTPDRVRETLFQLARDPGPDRAAAALDVFAAPARAGASGFYAARRHAVWLLIENRLDVRRKPSPRTRRCSICRT